MNRLAVALLGFVFAAFAAAPVRAQTTEADIGQQVYQQLAQKGEIIARPNAMYNVLDPITARIKRVADPQYNYPFTFILVHEKQPNAFAVPGGNVYVTDSLMKFVKNQEELAGVLCHETSHDIHHDVVNLAGKQQGQAAMIGIVGSLLGLDRSALGQLGEQIVFTVQTTRFDRAVETAADLKGSDTCATAAFNPWGMIWVFKAFEATGGNQGMEAVSDHPLDTHRISDLENHFRQNPRLFARFSSNIATGTPLTLAGRPSVTKPVARARTRSTSKNGLAHSSIWDKYNRRP
jgi:predicted Zn-dependent protease